MWIQSVIWNIGFWMCIVLVLPFFVVGILFAIFKGRSAKFVSGFNTLPKSEQDLYDKEYIARDIRNSCMLWSAIMFIGALCSVFITPYSSIVAYITWGILFFKDVHFDARKGFKKYLKK